MDVWRHPTPLSPHYDVMLPNVMKHRVVGLFERINVTHSIWIDDVHRLISDVRRQNGRRHRRNIRNFRFNVYHKYYEILRWMKSFARINSDLVSLIQVGTTYEGRRIMALKVLKNERRKVTIWQDALIHAREWIAGSTLLWLSQRLVRDYRNHDPDVTSLLENLDWTVLPVWNIDGYIHTWKEVWMLDRLWRKSRSEVGPFGCKGVDLNRNFYTPNRGVGVASENTCSGVYQGNFPFSEPESSSVSRYLSAQKLGAFISLHSYAQSLLYPYGYTPAHSLDNDDLVNVICRLWPPSTQVHGKTYRQGRVIDMAYIVNGGSVDWAHESLCVKYSYGVELRDRGRFGFLLPPRYIVPTAEEYYAAVIVIAKRVAGNET
uniref:Peptidase M14 domain-containing protein n=1 Tax=Ciona savignyi TaxID=51511 RepID=H2YLR5_CIOSA